MKGMQNEDKINRRIDEILDSFSGIKRAEGAPYLLTRIYAKMNLPANSSWERLASFICKPEVWALGLFFILLLNISVIVANKSSAAVAVQEHISNINFEDEFTANYTTFDNTDTP